MSRRVITDHHDGHGLNDVIIIKADELGPGGASHEYDLALEFSDGKGVRVGYLQFQKGPRNVETSRPGLTEAAVLSVLIDRLRSFQAGEYSCRENAIALTHLETAHLWMKERANARAKRGVLGTMLKSVLLVLALGGAVVTTSAQTFPPFPPRPPIPRELRCVTVYNGTGHAFTVVEQPSQVIWMALPTNIDPTIPYEQCWWLPKAVRR